MYLEKDELVFSPSDLTQYMDSPFASWMDHLALTHPELSATVDEKDAMMMLLQHKGYIHEHEVLARFQEKGLMVANLHKTTQGLSATIAAMQKGADIIYQAALSLPPFQGIADFLVKVKGESLLGDFHYEVWDSKLASTAKPDFLIQLCCYAEMLATIQGRKAEHMVLLLGNGEQKRLKTADYFYYYHYLKQAFLQSHKLFNPENCPDPLASNSWGRWSQYADKLFNQSDSLINVATITKSQIKKLQKAGINTMRQLADCNSERVNGINPAVFSRLKAQASIQKDSLGHARPLYKILPQDGQKKQGLALLPPASAGDVFFDIEGYPLVEGGLEYLWGAAYFDEQGIRRYKDFWAHDSLQEKECFQQFMEWVYTRWLHDNSMHIYHYAAYEISACRKLMGRYGICEFEVDQLLRNEVFVDLYKIIKASLLLGEPRYSIKNVEHLYRPQRNTLVGSGGDSVVVYEGWQENPDGESWQTSKILNDIRDYNIDDCNSTQELVDWLRLRQQEAGITFLGNTQVLIPEFKEETNQRVTLRDHLLSKGQELKEKGLLTQATLHALFAWSLEFHRREAKPVFWRLFDRLSLSDEELLDDIDCLSYCSRTDTPPYKPTSKARHMAYEYIFDSNQAFKAACKQYFLLGHETGEGKRVKANFIREGSCIADGRIILQMPSAIDSTITLIPDEYVSPEPIPLAIMKSAQAFTDGQLVNCAIIDLLTKSKPKILGHRMGQPIAASHDPKLRLQQIIQAVIKLDNSYLTIQGPPGAGKTYTGKHIIAELLKKGKKIGISSNSHKAINNLLLATARYCQEEKIAGFFAVTSDTDGLLQDLGIRILQNAAIENHVQPGCVIGTTAWGFARDSLEASFDYLFIDEAGQVSLANIIAMSRATKNIILMGDQMQLSQPSQGSHPDESGLSVLDYLLHSTPTIPDDMGVFLETTYRMHSAITHFISDAVYDGKLQVAAENDRQRVEVPDGYHGILNKNVGIIPVAVAHEGNTQASDEEVGEIVSLVNELLGRVFIAKDGSKRCLEWKDILIMAPYNHQVNKLKEALGEKAQVGSVDKFQGQEAPVVFLSMCASNADESPRGVSFLFDKNRINVAISRAQCLAIVVYSPALLDTPVGDIKQLALLNLFCKLTSTKKYAL